jgi:formylglycine-generating enzyme required for sulfatase activity
MSETEKPDSSKPKRKPVKPLPRLWKTEPEPGEGDDPAAGPSPSPKKVKKRDESAAADSPAAAKQVKGRSKPPKAKEAAGKANPSEKKVLKEDTPTLDTYESRQRARLIMGGLCALCVVLSIWIFYRTFLYDPLPMEVTSGDPTAAPFGPEIKPSFDQEARFMFNRARELAKNGRNDLAIAKLNEIAKISAYRGTPTAAEAKAALERAAKDLPLFPDRPVLEAQQPVPDAQPKPAPPPAVVAVNPDPASPTERQAALLLPANPAEPLVIPPGSQVRTAPSSAVAARALPAGFHANLELGVHESGWPRVITSDRDGATMMFIPGGTFTMGNNDGERVEAPAHSVRLSAYYIDQHEVTYGQFRIFLGESHYHGQPAGKWLTDEKERGKADKLPVVNVSASDAKAFADWAGKTLPSEAQWEFAARSTDGRHYPWGDSPPTWSRPRTFHQIDPVMTFIEDASPYGVCDMAGNVLEWTKDWFDKSYYRQIATGTTDNPAGASKRSGSDQLVVKGGSKSWSVTYREGVPHTKRLPYLGFRCVLAVETSLPAPAGAAPTPPGSLPGPPGVPAGGPSKPPPVPF